MDLSSQIATEGAQVVADATTNLTAVAPFGLAIIGAFAVLGLIYRAFRKGTRG